METPYCKIPFYEKLNPLNFKAFTQNFNKNSIVLPVDIADGEVIIPEININDNIKIPTCISTAHNGFCTIPLEIEETPNEIIKFNKPVEIIPLYAVEIAKPPLENVIHSNVSNIIRHDHLNPEEKKKIITLCSKFKDIFYKENVNLSFTNAIKHHIRTAGNDPIYCKSYRYPYHLKQEIQSQIEKLLKNKIIRPSISPYSSPVWIVPKKLDASGKRKWRLVVDYRKLNDKTIEDKYPLPRIEEILDSLGKCCYFTTLDLAQGFHQIEVEPESIEKTAFSVNNGHYEYVRMPFGLKNAPATFQRVMDNIFKEYLYKFCFVYMDDIVIFSKSLQEHITHIEQIFSKLREFNLKVQLDKSEFLRKEVAYLGHVITPEGIKPNPDKIETIKKYPLPKTQKEIKAFLGLIGYYRRFIKDFARITQPFTKCLKKNSKIDITNTEYLESFNLCKQILINAPILQYPDFQKTFILTTDASNVAIGGILSQGRIGQDKPIAYYSRTLNSAERNYSTVERELLAMVEATKHFRPYLYGRKFICITDHKPLAWLSSLKEPNSRLMKWKLKLEEFDYEVQYKKGKENTNVDALSRIEINTKIVQNKKDDNDDDLLSILPQVDVEDILSNNELDEILEQEPYIESNNESDDQTNHTAIENPSFNMPISEKLLNDFHNQIIFAHGPLYDFSISRPFGKFQYMLVIKKGNEEDDIKKVLKEIITPNKLYGVYFENQILEHEVRKIMSKIFNENNVKFIKCTKLAKDVVKTDTQSKIIKDYHNSNHNGINETYEHLKRDFYWPNMKNKISLFINKCEICLQSKYERNPYKTIFSGPLVAKRPFEIVHGDIFRFNNHKFLTLIDLFSKYAQAYYIENTQAITILKKLRHFFTHHNYPTKLVFDSGGEFNNDLIKEYCKLFKINLHITTVENHSSNSPVERLHSTLLEKLRTLHLENPQESVIDLIISSILIYNSSIHSKTGFTPFELLYGPYENLNLHKIDLDLKIYQDYNEKRKREILPFFNHLYQKQLDKGTRTLEKVNEKRVNNPEISEPIVYKRTKQIQSKIAPIYKPVRVIEQQDDTIIGCLPKSNKITTLNKRNVKPIRKNYLQVDPDDNPQPGPSHS